MAARVSVSSLLVDGSESVCFFSLTVDAAVGKVGSAMEAGVSPLDRCWTHSFPPSSLRTSLRLFGSILSLRKNKRRSTHDFYKNWWVKTRYGGFFLYPPVTSCSMRVRSFALRSIDVNFLLAIRLHFGCSLKFRGCVCWVMAARESVCSSRIFSVFLRSSWSNVWLYSVIFSVFLRSSWSNVWLYSVIFSVFLRSSWSNVWLYSVIFSVFLRSSWSNVWLYSVIFCLLEVFLEQCWLYSMHKKYHIFIKHVLSNFSQW